MLQSFKYFITQLYSNKLVPWVLEAQEDAGLPREVTTCPLRTPHLLPSHRTGSGSGCRGQPHA